MPRVARFLEGTVVMSKAELDDGMTSWFCTSLNKKVLMSVFAVACSSVHAEFNHDSQNEMWTMHLVCPQGDLENELNRLLHAGSIQDGGTNDNSDGKSEGMPSECTSRTRH